MNRIPRRRRMAIYAGSGMAIGIAMGLLFGLMLVEGGFLFPVAGALFGVVVGAIWAL